MYQVNDSNVKVIYHGGCWDGFCAAWLFHKVHPGAEFVPAQYGQPAPDCTGKVVYILDFSYKREVMRKILSQAMFVCVLDHHKTAQAELADLTGEFCQRPDLISNPLGSELPFIWFDMNKSGGRLTWEYLWKYHYGTKYSEIWQPETGIRLNLDRAPWLVDYTEDRDLWRWNLPYSREINASLRTLPLDFEAWDLLERASNLDVMRTEGTAILRREKQIVDDHIRHAREIEMEGHKILAVNATVLFSDIAGTLAQGRPFGAAYFDRSDGKRQWSLRSNDEGIDVSEVAKLHGGGGHRNAAGFEEMQ